jgi:hypothetical protein
MGGQYSCALRFAVRADALGAFCRSIAFSVISSQYKIVLAP